MVNDQDDNGPNHGDQKAVQIEAGDADSAEPIEQPSTDHRADNPQEYIEDNPFASSVHQLAADEARQQSQNDPSNKRHGFVLPLSACLPQSLIDIRT
jgi:hypothetical protein